MLGICVFICKIIFVYTNIQIFLYTRIWTWVIQMSRAIDMSYIYIYIHIYIHMFIFDDIHTYSCIYIKI